MNEFDNKLTLMDAFLYAAEGKDPSLAIENQEKRGQQMVVENCRLPKKMNGMSLPYDIRWAGIDDTMDWDTKTAIINKNNVEYTKEQYEKMGIEIIDEYDDLFWNVSLPEGWKIEATDHHMWNNLYDNKGRKRATFFYKAAFYDRDAFINLSTRYSIGVDHIGDILKDYDAWVKSDFQGFVKDGDTVISSTDCIPCTGDYWKDEDIKKSLLNNLEQYMEEHYPNYKDIHAYWD